METMRVKLDEGAFKPTRAHSTDAGLDLYSTRDAWIRAGGNEVFHTGVHIELPPGTAGLIVSKSGLNTRHSITSTGLIDEGYTGEIVVKLYNHGYHDFHVQRGDKISQLVLIDIWYDRVDVVDEIAGGERGEDGFGSTGR
jgi:dUTP pyrophosphatase